jgi:hypothetical protein
VLGLKIGTGVGDCGVNVTTIGTPAKTLIEHRNGSTWASGPSPIVNGASRLTAAASVPGGGVWAIGLQRHLGRIQSAGNQDRGLGRVPHSPGWVGPAVISPSAGYDLPSSAGPATSKPDLPG